MKLNKPQIALRKFAKPHRVQALMYFFKTGPGQYGEGDQFIGISVPENRSVAVQFLHVTDAEIAQLFKSPIHEDRLLALHIMTEKYKKTKDLNIKKKLMLQYLKHKKYVNNWDLVDTSAAKILGDYCYRTKNFAPLIKLSKSKHHWDKRIAVVGTHALIRNGQVDLTFSFAQKFLTEKEDLMHKATGWMLREAGKKDLKKLLAFIDRHGQKMPRTMLRYSIEKLTPAHRQKILLATRC